VRELADTDRIARFMKALGEAAREETHAHLVGGATAVLYGWRATTIDVDLKLVPESDSVLRAIPQIKESLQLNVELASPPDFIPVPDGWEDRGAYVRREGRVSFFHFDIYAQARRSSAVMPVTWRTSTRWWSTGSSSRLACATTSPGSSRSSTAFQPSTPPHFGGRSRNASVASRANGK